MRRPITTFSALLALGLSACFNSNTVTTQDKKDPSPKITDTKDTTKDTTNSTTPDIKKTDPKSEPPKIAKNSVVLDTLKVSPTPGLKDASGYRERNDGYAGGYGEAEPGRGVPAMEAPAEAKGDRAGSGGPAAPKMMVPAKPTAVAPPPPPGTEAGGVGFFGDGERHMAQAAGPLKAGEIDDNKLFPDYEEYLKKHAQILGVSKVDVSKRVRLTIVDEAGKPVHDANVTLSVGGQPWLRAKSHSNGGVVLFPMAAGQLPQGQKVTVQVSKGDLSMEREIDGLSTEEKITLKGAPDDDKARLDLVFCIDTTGSMGDEIAQIQSTVQDIITKTKGLPSAPEVRLGMVLYGDRGDIYTTRVYDFTSDAEKFKSSVASIAMTSGGDIPEDLNSGLEDTIESLEWNNQEAVRMVFLIGDAAPHMDYNQQYDYKVAMLRAAEQGIKIFPLASSGLETTGEYVFRQLALFTEAHFLFLTYGATGTTSMDVDRDNYTPDKLDDVVIKLITEELKPLAQ